MVMRKKNYFILMLKGRRSRTLYGVCGDSGVPISSFGGISQLDMNHIQTIYIEPTHTNIEEAISVAQYFPNFVRAEDNMDLMVEVLEGEL